MQYGCTDCGAICDELLECCPSCGHFKTYRAIVRRPMDSILRDTRLESTAELVRRSTPKLELGPYTDVFGMLPRSRFVLLVYGPPGCGKTSFLLRFADVLSQSGRVLFNAIEEGAGPSFLRKLRQFEIVNEDIHVGVINDLDNLVALACDFSFLVIDSYNGSLLSPSDLARIMRECDISLLLSLHVRRDGEARCESAVLHLADVVLRLDGSRQYVVEKNRFASLTQGTLP